MNKAILIGNISREPELSTIPNGTSICKFSIAVNRRFANAEGNRDCDFFNIVAWRVLGENVGKFCKKGNKVGIVGTIQTRTYDAADGTKRHVTEIVADEVEFLSKIGENTTTSPSKDTELTPIEDLQLPF